MRTLFVGMVCSIILIFFPIVSDGSVLDEQTVIIEVDGDPHQRAEELKKEDAFLDILAVYDTLLQGVAVKGKQTTIQKLLHVSYVRTLHPVHMYEGVQLKDHSASADSVFPNDTHSTSFTGKGVKVGVVDTGIDYTHKDLQKNYQGGYDVVDFDDDPMETLEEIGMPTLHGTHVSGIIAANGELLGVAPDAEIHAYRALGPGGQGTSVQVIAAMEEAVKDGVDILNLSLGNTINGPDFPTSIAVNKAEELGVITVIANGNAGPATWTVGSPATASQTLSVGALDQAHTSVSLYEPITQTDVSLIEMMGSTAWNLTKDYPLVEYSNEARMGGAIVLAKRDEIPFTEKALAAQKEGAVALIVYDSASEEDFQGAIDQEGEPITIPVVSIDKQDAEQLLKQKSAFIQTLYTQVPDRVATFSSRGPVTIDWQIKPDILAPGARILSTVPGGYAELQGTSMAAPHVAGGLALLKEAHPTWTNKQLIASLLTTADRLETSEGVPFLPIEQGMGTMNIDAAVETNTLLHNPKLSFGKVSGFKDQKTAIVTVENISPDEQTFHFSIPRKIKGIQWTLPMSFTVQPKEKKDIPITIDVTHLTADGLHQGWLDLYQEDQLYHLPYLFVSQDADQPKTMGFDFYKDPIVKNSFAYQMYVTEKVDTLIVDLYDPESLMHKGTLLQVDQLEAGMNEGSISVKEVPHEGVFVAVLSMYLSSGEIEYEVVPLVITSEE